MAVPVDPAVAAHAPARAVADPGLPVPPVPPAEPAEAVGGQQEQLNEVLICRGFCVVLLSIPGFSYVCRVSVLAKHSLVCRARFSMPCNGSSLTFSRVWSTFWHAVCRLYLTFARVSSTN